MYMYYRLNLMRFDILQSFWDINMLTIATLYQEVESQQEMTNLAGLRMLWVVVGTLTSKPKVHPCVTD